MNNFEYFINEKERAPAGQVYLGAFLATTLFVSFFFGSLLFFILVLIISIFIFLDKEVSQADEYGRVKVSFGDNGFSYGRTYYNYSDCRSFSIHKELFGEEELYLRFSFVSRGRQDLFIYLPTEMHLKKVYDIIYKSVKEDKNKKLSFTEELFIRFF
jgi:hypothetical protein